MSVSNDFRAVGKPQMFVPPPAMVYQRGNLVVVDSSLDLTTLTPFSARDEIV